VRAVSHRPFKDRLYAEFAIIGMALASPTRLELLDLLGQGERSVDELEQRLAEIPRDREVVACCRGPLCVFSE
jgi:DNA-binding transcriptional ArsR family regulator